MEVITSGVMVESDYRGFMAGGIQTKTIHIGHSVVGKHNGKHCVTFETVF